MDVADVKVIVHCRIWGVFAEENAVYKTNAIVTGTLFFFFFFFIILLFALVTGLLIKKQINLKSVKCRGLVCTGRNCFYRVIRCWQFDRLIEQKNTVQGALQSDES